MNLFKYILIGVLFVSCASYQEKSITYAHSEYTFKYYDYNSLHFMYVNNPSYFYNTFYINKYGIRRYYYTHPYFIRYYTYRKIIPNHNYYIQRRNNRTGPYRRRRLLSPIRRSNTTRRSTTRTNTSSTVRRQNMTSRKKIIKSKSRISRSY